MVESLSVEDLMVREWGLGFGERKVVVVVGLWVTGCEERDSEDGIAEGGREGVFNLA